MLVTRIIPSFAKEQPRWQFCSIEGFFTELTQLHVLIIGLDEGKQQCPLFKHFSTSVINLFFTLSMNHLKFKATEQLLKVIQNMVMGIWSYGVMFWLFYHLKMILLKLRMFNVHKHIVQNNDLLRQPLFGNCCSLPEISFYYQSVSIGYLAV